VSSRRLVRGPNAQSVPMLMIWHSSARGDEGLPGPDQEDCRPTNGTSNSMINPIDFLWIFFFLLSRAYSHCQNTEHIQEEEGDERTCKIFLARSLRFFAVFSSTGTSEGGAFAPSSSATAEVEEDVSWLVAVASFPSMISCACLIVNCAKKIIITYYFSRLDNGTSREAPCIPSMYSSRSSNAFFVTCKFPRPVGDKSALLQRNPYDMAVKSMLEQIRLVFLVELPRIAIVLPQC